MDPTERFTSIVEHGGEPLDELALTIAAHARADLDLDEELERIDDLADGLVARDEVSLMAELFGTGRFRGDTEHYYDDRNSFLDQVLRRRCGIPITLSVLAIAVGRRRGVGLVGISMPGHFLLRSATDRTWFDPFGGGAPLDLAGCEVRYRRLHPTGRFSEVLLEPVGPIPIAARMLANLTQIYLDRQAVADLTWVLRLRCLLPGADPALRRQLAGVLAHRGHFWEAAEHFERLARLQPDRAESHLAAARRLRARHN